MDVRKRLVRADRASEWSGGWDEEAPSRAILGEAETGADFPAVRVLLRRRPPWRLPPARPLRAYRPRMWRAGRLTLPTCSAARPAHPGAWPARACVVDDRCGGAGEAVASSALVSSLKGVTAVGCPRPLLPSRFHQTNALQAEIREFYTLTLTDEEREMSFASQM
nr:testis-expressed protein 30 isoform X3 [Chlorocebus sabaeus]